MALPYEKIETIAKEILLVSRNTLIINLRFMDKAISLLECQATQQEYGLYVDGRQIVYHPLSVLQLFKEGRNVPAHAYLHMVLHCIFQHFWISNSVNQDYWDLACDIAVEHTILDLNLSELSSEKDELRSEEIRKLKKRNKYITADYLYKYFCAHNLKVKELQRLKKLFEYDHHQFWYLSNLKISQESDQSQSNHAEEGENDSNSITRLSFSQLQQMVQEWKEVARQIKLDIETFSKNQGDVAGGLTQNLLSITREKYDYESFLRKFAVLGERMRINDEEFDYIFYTYGLQLYEKMPLIEPLEYKEVKQIKEFVIAIDTSGSTSGDLVQTFITKTYNILKEEESISTRFNIHIVQCDAEIQESVKISNQSEFDQYINTMQIRGLGGTDFRPVFAYVDDMIKKREFTNLQGMIYFTDGFGTFPEKQPEYNVAFVYIEEGYENPEVPIWAIKLVLQPEEIGGNRIEH